MRKLIDRLKLRQFTARDRGTVLTAFLIGFMVSMVLLAGCAGGTKHVAVPGMTPLPPAVTIQGDVTVPADSVNSDNTKGGQCTGADGYGDIAVGAEIAVKSPSGVVIKTGTLNNGITSALFADDGSIIAGTAEECSYHFQIDGVNGGLDLYGITVGNAFRGTIHYTHDQVAQPIQIRIGG